MADSATPLRKVSLDDKYALDATRAYMTGIEALVRLPMLQWVTVLGSGHQIGEIWPCGRMTAGIA